MNNNYYKSNIVNVLWTIFINFLIILAFSGFFTNSLYLKNPLYAFYGALLITLFYKFIRPLFLLISIVPIILTFGFFIVIINAVIISLVSNILSPNFYISSFYSALGLALFISIFNLFINTKDRNIIIKRYK